MTDGWGTLTFHIPNPLNQNIATWKARRFGEKVEVFDDSSNLLWDGVIVKIGTGDPLKISCMVIRTHLKNDLAKTFMPINISEIVGSGNE